MAFMSHLPRVALTLEQFWHRVPGGTATAVWALTRALAADPEWEVIGVSAWHKERAPQRFRLPIGIEWLPLPRPLLYESWHKLRLPRVEFATGPVEVIHATTLAIPPKSAPLVVTVHDLAFLEDPDHFTPRGNRLALRGVELTKKDADLVVCPSHATRAACEEHGFDARRLRVVPWGVESRAATEEECRWVRERFQVERPYVLWTGTVEPRKNLGRLIDAFLTLDTDVELLLAGPLGWNEDLDALLGRGAGRIRALGFVEPQELSALYAQALAFCYPSLMEGFGLPVLEAMAQGAPVVTSRATATEEVAGDAAVLVDPKDVSSIAEGLRKVLDDEALRDTLASAGRERAEQMSWERCASGMRSVYSEVAA